MHFLHFFLYYCTVLLHNTFSAFSEEKPVSGTEVFGFKTPKRRGALAQAGEFSWTMC